MLKKLIAIALPLCMVLGLFAGVAMPGVAYAGTVSDTNSIPHWKTVVSNDAKCSFSFDSVEKHSGNLSVKLTNSSPQTPYVYGSLIQSVTVKPNTKYKLSLWAKAASSKGVHISVISNSDRHVLSEGTYDWKPVELTRTTGGSQTSLNLSFILNNITEGLWIDDIVLQEVGSDGNVTGSNLIKNGDFEIRGKATDVTASPMQGAAAMGTEVTLSTATQEADIYYTVDGSDPVASQTAVRYTAPIVLYSDTTIKAYARKDGMTDSNVSSFNYTLEPWTEGNAFFELDKYMENQTIVPVTKAAGMTIDGNLDDWNGYPKIALPSDIDSQVKVNGWGGASDLSAEAGLTYDDRNLFIGIKVKDNVHKAYAGDTMWSGDSIQLGFSKDGLNYGPEYGLADVNDQPSVWRWVQGSAILGKDSITLQTSRIGDETIYEAAIPWQAIVPGDVDEKLMFTFLINDNDGSGRRGWIEWTPGIGSKKDASGLKTLLFLQEGQDWFSWLTGQREIQTGEQAKFALSIPNYSDQSKNMKISIPSIGLENEMIQIPAKKVFRKGFSTSFSSLGDQIITASIVEEATGKARNESFAVNVIKDAASIKNQLDELLSRLPVLEELLQQCKERNLPVDYETVDYTTIQEFIPYGMDDINHDYLTRAAYVADELEKLYTEAADNLNAYLNGSKKAAAVPRYVSGRPEIRNYSFIGDTKTGNAENTEKRPIFFTGYGHFTQVRRDISKFGAFGANIIQIEKGPNSVILNPETVDGWKTAANGGAKVSFVLDKEVFHSGLSSLKVINTTPKQSNVYGTIWQTFSVKPNTTYKISAWVKGDNAGAASLTTNWIDRHFLKTGTYDWQQTEFNVTTGSEENALNLRLISDDVTAGLWIDDLTMIEQNTSSDLLVNGAFEQIFPIVGDYKISTAGLEDDILKVLKNAEQNNIAVNLLLSPHYFPSWVLQKWPELKINNNGFIKYSITAPRTKEVIELYLRTVIPLIKDYKSLHSITLSNEPVYYSRVDSFAQAPWHEFLQNQYLDIGALNSAYGTGYAAFDQVPMPSEYEPSVIYYDWVKFNNRLFADWHKWMADIIHEIAPEIPVQTKIMAFLRGAVDYGVDPEDFSEISQINGDDNWNYLGNGATGFLKMNMFYDLQCSLKEVPVFNSEDHVISDGDDRYVPEQAIHVGADLWQGAVHGKTASTVWVWERTYDENSVAAGSLLHRPDVVSKIGKTNLDLNRLAYEVTALQNIQPEAAILYSHSSLTYSKQGYQDAMLKAYEAITYSGQKAGIVSEKQIKEKGLGDYKLLIVPGATHVSHSTLNGIKSFIASGGKVIVIGNDSLGKDEHNQVLPEEAASYVKSNSLMVSSSITARELRSSVLDILNTLGLNKVMLIDKATNEPVYGVEWLSTEYKGKTIVNIMNYEQAPKDVYLRVNGNHVNKWDELISRNKVESDELKLDWIRPNLLAFEVDDTTPPVTAIKVVGTEKNGWYGSDVTVTMSVYDDLSEADKTEYRIGDGDWTVYTEPVVMTQEGTYTVQYRSTDKAGNVEDIRQQTLQMDKTPAEFNLIANGNILNEGASFEDYMPLTFKVWDNRSGVASAQMRVSDAVYGDVPHTQSSLDIDLAGKAGSYTAVITIGDIAGNRLERSFSFTVTTSIDSIRQLIDRYAGANELGEPLLKQLTNSLDQAQHQLDKGRPDQAAKHLEDFIKHLNNEAQANNVNDMVKTILNADAEALIKLWSEGKR